MLNVFGASHSFQKYVWAQSCRDRIKIALRRQRPYNQPTLFFQYKTYTHAFSVPVNMAWSCCYYYFVKPPSNPAFLLKWRCIPRLIWKEITLLPTLLRSRSLWKELNRLRNHLVLVSFLPILPLPTALGKAPINDNTLPF